MVDSTDLAQVLHEAQDIARSVAQKPTSAHVLLALFTVENRAQLLLKEKGVDEDALLQLITEAPAETGSVVNELTTRARELASNSRSGEADCLHLLIAIIRKRCAASDLLARTGIDLISLSNTALSYSTSGGPPRRLQPGYGQAVTTRAPVSRPVGAPPSPLPFSTLALSVPRPAPVMTPPVTVPPPAPRMTPALSPRDLIDVDEDDSALNAQAEPAVPPMPRMAPPAPVA
ncbi:ATP-dependent Clp protease ATP-binding subunit, partial [Corallococcus sp. CA047B]|uniref:Clp protease N-terminal domain-containing protein n=1 Tax=Corallococcus sp. CA047B TaxID=2316729 RepID=UPI000EC24126